MVFRFDSHVRCSINFDKKFGQLTAFMKSSISRSIKLNQNRGGFRRRNAHRTTFCSIHVKIEDQSWFIFNSFVKKRAVTLDRTSNGQVNAIGQANVYI